MRQIKFVGSFKCENLEGQIHLAGTHFPRVRESVEIRERVEQFADDVEQRR